MVYLHPTCVYTSLYAPQAFVSQLATGINHSQPILTKYCAFGSLLAVISVLQVVECMTRIWSVAMAYRCPICIEGIVYVLCNIGFLYLSRPLRLISPTILYLFLKMSIYQLQPPQTSWGWNDSDYCAHYVSVSV